MAPPVNRLLGCFVGLGTCPSAAYAKLRLCILEISEPQLCAGAQRRCGGRGDADGELCPSPQSCGLPAKHAARQKLWCGCARIPRCHPTTPAPSVSFSYL